ncbi:hypothetical protein BRARA_I00176, partial [Brassica rapa]
MKSEGVLSLLENQALIHEHPMIPWNDLRIGDCCQRFESLSDGYYCKICDFFVHEKCCDRIHPHPMMPWNDLRKGDCCRSFESLSDGYFCTICEFFLHKKCCELSEFIDHPSHPNHTLQLEQNPDTSTSTLCDLCGRKILNPFYRCEMCDFDVDLHCVKYPPPDVINNFETHCHKLTLLKERTGIEDCPAKCGQNYIVFPYKCDECDVAFHVDCVWHPTPLNHPTEVNHPYHSLHPLKLLTGPPPDYSDGKCRLCGRGVDKELFYHCSSCNFTLDMRCVLNPPPQSLVDSKVHDHQLTLLPRLDSFTYRSPYACFQCGFMIHQDCLGLPRVININRHDHRIYRTSVLGVVNSVCGVCRKKVDWTCGGFTCQKCPAYVVHSKCATRNDVWNGEDLEGVPEEEEDIEPYVVIDDNTIQHFSHKEHYLRLHGNGIMYEDNKRCSACTHPIGLQSFYGCTGCDFSLHQNCAECPKKKRHVLHNERLTLVTNKELEVFTCQVCNRKSNGFILYKHENMTLDVLCGSISEPFVHPSHPHHPLYYMPTEECKKCKGCNYYDYRELRCIEGDCGFVLCFKCAIIPQVVKHRVDNHPLSLCYGEEETSGKYWCDICERETNPKNWFYTCKDQRASLHTWCVHGDSTGLMLRSVAKLWGSISYEVVFNNSVTRPFCSQCKFRCMYPINFKLPGTTETYICST